MTLDHAGANFSPALDGWPAEVRAIHFASSGDHTEQPALFLARKATAPQPMVIFLHQWRGDYLYKGGIPLAEWCAEKGWIFAQPDFRGPNTHRGAMGSDLVVADIKSLIDYAREHAFVDDSLIFLAGPSGGGHAALLAAGRLPGVFRAVSAWVPITDLVAWHAQSEALGHSRYARDIEAACGGPPLPGSEAEKEAVRRSPLTYLVRAGGVKIDLNAGIHDGHGRGTVPISHTLHAFNLLAHPTDAISASDIEILTEKAFVSETLRFAGTDASYGAKRVLFRRESKDVRITLFEGGHEFIPSAAQAWLEAIAASG